MHCALDIAEFHRLLIESAGDVHGAAMGYFGTDDAGFAMRCLGVDLTCSAREAPALAGYVQNMGFRGCSPDRIAAFLYRYEARISNPARQHQSGWRVFGWMHRDTRLRWEPLASVRLRVV